MTIIDQATFWHNLTEFLIVIPAAAISFSPFIPDLRKKRFFSVTMIFVALFAAVIAGAFACTRYGFPDLYFYYAFIPVYVLLYFIVLRKAFFKKAFFAVNALFLAAFCCLYGKFVSAGLISWLSGKVPDIFLDTNIVVLGLALVFLLLFQILIRGGFYHMQANPRLNYIWKWLTLLPLFFSFLVCWAYPQNLEDLFQGTARPIALVSLALVPLGVLGVYRIIITLMNRLNENAKLQKEIELLRIENKRYEQLRVLMDRSRTVRHDMRQHLLAIDRLAREGRSEQIAEYVEPLIEVAANSNKFFCANTIVDAVAAHYDALAEQQETKVEWTLELPQKLAFLESDVCSVLGNLLENALKAVKSLAKPQRVVTVSVTMLSEEILGIVVKNPYEGKVSFKKNGLPRSGKPGHGIGLSSVAMVANKYGGSMNLSARGGVFSVGVLMYAEAPKRTLSLEADSE